MRTLLFAAALACCDHALAEVHGFLLPRVTRTAVRASPVNPGNLLQLPALESELAFGVRGETAGFVWRARAQLSTSRLDGRTHTSVDGALQELSRTLQLSETLSLVVGKRILAWDVAYSSNPLGFFQKSPDLADLGDRLERAEGLPLIALSRLGATTDFTLVYSDDRGARPDGFNRGLRQLAANLTWSHPGGSYSLVVQKPRGQPVGLGLAVSATVADTLTLHASALSRRGTRRPISRRVLDEAPGFDIEDPNGPWREDARERFAHWVAGAHWTPASHTSLIVEYGRDDAGLDERQWAFWTRLVEHHAAAPLAGPDGAAPIHAPLRRLNLAFDASALLPRGARREYVFARASRGASRWDLAALWRVGLADGSLLVNVSIERELHARVAVGLSGSHLSGPPGSEYDYLPLRSSIQLWLKYAF